MKKTNEFLDANHKAMDTYYLLMEKDVSIKKMKLILEELIEIDPDFYDPYIQLANILQENEEYERASKILHIAIKELLQELQIKKEISLKAYPGYGLKIDISFEQ